MLRLISLILSRSATSKLLEGQPHNIALEPSALLVARVPRLSADVSQTGLMNRYNWSNQQDLPSRGYTCGYCNRPLASAKGWHGAFEQNGQLRAFVFICHHCTSPTYIDHEGSQWPGVVFGNSVNDIPEKSVADLYDEARKATGAGAYTGAVLCCRKLLMHIAVAKGAATGQTFAAYVDYLSANHHISPDAKEWVDHIRTKGNEANHEIVIVGADDAKDLLSFCEMLLKTIFEFPAVIRKKLSPAKP